MEQPMSALLDPDGYLMAYLMGSVKQPMDYLMGYLTPPGLLHGLSHGTSRIPWAIAYDNHGLCDIRRTCTYAHPWAKFYSWDIHGIVHVQCDIPWERSWLSHGIPHGI